MTAGHDGGREFKSFILSPSLACARQPPLRGGRGDVGIAPYMRLCHEIPHFNGAFFIRAQVRGNWGGVSFTLRMTTTRWVTSVPGMV